MTYICLKKNLSSYMIMLCLAAGLASCGSSRVTTAHATGRHRTTATIHGKTPTGKIEIPQSMAGESKALLSEASKWLGVPYRYGGTDTNGVDCSGLTMGIFEKALDIKLPRNSAKQSEFCQDITADMLIPGDLVFFDTSSSRNGKISHVGLYIGDGQMIHSSTSKGVIVSSIVDNYYSERFITGGRVGQYYAKLSKTPKSQMPLPDDSDKTEKSAQAYRYVAVNKPSPRQRKSNPNPAPVKHETHVATPNPAASTIANPDDARSAVLNSLIEEKIDSIYAGNDTVQR